MSHSEASDASNLIAIVGMAGRFPGAKDLAQYWENLRDGVESIRFFTDAELVAAGVEARRLNDPAYVRAAGVLEEIELFDADFFGINPREAEITDPQQRLFLECAWEALEGAGYDAGRYQGAIGVYAGVGRNTYWVNLLSDSLLMASMGEQILHGNDKDFLATLVSYKMNLRGPSVTVQTACSTSLVAVHLACQSLLNGECDMALAGGSRVGARQVGGHYYREGGIASPDGHCRAFDRDANGTVGGNGVGVVVLKRLADALAEGDSIHAVIKGSAINNDGSMKIGYTAPSVNGQADVISEALAVARVRPDEITYVEAHGTGTRLGDPIEIKALTQAFRLGTDKKGFCAIGSVKTNFGHLDAAAGVAGLIKTVLALKHGLLPPSLNCTRPNPLLELEDSPFFINTALSPWQSNGRPRRAGVSSFGIGGTNSHVILEEAPRTETTPSARPFHVLLLSARTPGALQQATERLHGHLKQNPTARLADVAYTLQVGRRAFSHRRSLVCADVGEAIDALEMSDPQRVMSGEAGARPRQVAFMFSGQGTQRPNMGRQIYRSEPCFREWIDTCAGLIGSRQGYDLRNLLYPRSGEEEAAATALQETRLAQPALFVVEYALARWLMKCGINPTAMIGHSLGEYVAACLAGVMTLEDALRVVVERGRLMQEMPAGAMLAVQMEEEEITRRLGGPLWLAAVNGGGQCVISGTVERIAALETKLQGDGIGCQRLRTKHAFHSGLMDGMLEPFADVLGEVSLGPPSLPFLSNVTGNWIRPEEATNKQYWLRQVREPVRFGAGVRALAEDTALALLEVGPGETLCGLSRLQARNSVVLATLGAVRGERGSLDEVERFYEAVGQLWACGAEVDWEALYEYEQRRRISLPTYPFERERYWIDRQRTGTQPRDPSGVTDAGRMNKRQEVSRWFYVPVWKQTPLPWLGRRPKTGRKRATWLVLAARNSVSQGVRQMLEQVGEDVISVEMGESFADFGAGHYQIHPGCPAHYAELLKSLQAKGQFPRQVLHMWCLEAEEEAEKEAGEERVDRDKALARAQELGFFSLLYLAQALGETRWRTVAEGKAAELRIAVVTRGTQEVSGEEELRPEQATALGPCRAIPQEYEFVTCRSIDVVIPAAGSLQEDRLISLLVEELTSDVDEPLVAYRGGQRWVLAYESVPVEQGNEEGPLSAGGVFLITGGLGRIGLELAGYLCRELKAKVALVGRKRLPPREQWKEQLQKAGCPVNTRRLLGRLMSIDKSGGEVCVERADVTDEAAMKEVIRQVKARWGRLDGVIHGAGMQGDDSLGLMSEMDREKCEAVFRPKVSGVNVLERVLEDEELDFCLLMSSVVTVFGGPGSSAYAGASHFLDAFVRAHNRRSRQRWTSVSWEGWNFNGSETNERSEIKEESARLALEPSEGVEVFTRLMETREAVQLVVSTADIGARIRQSINHRGRREGGVSQGGPKWVRHRRPVLNNSYEAAGDELEEQMVGVWEEMLGIRPIGVTDNFFELGGHSLLATQVVSRIRNKLGVEVGLRSLFEETTVRGMAEVVRLQMGTEALVERNEIVSVGRERPLPLSYAQQRLWFIHQLEPDNPAYNIPMAVRLRGTLSVTALRQSLQEIVRRHEVLRTRFDARDGQPIQVIEEPAEIDVPTWDMSDLPQGERERRAREIVAQEARRPFDLRDGPVWKAALLRIAPEDHVLVLTIHHVAGDGWSTGVLVREFTAFYSGYRKGQRTALPDLTVQYADFAIWQREWLRGEVLEEQRAYWRQRLAGVPVLELPTDHPRPAAPSHRGGTVPLRLSAELTDGLRMLSRQEGATLFMTLLAGFQTLLGRYAGQDDVVVGTDVANRNRLETEELIGFFVNQLVLRTDLSGGVSFRELLQRVRETTVDAYGHQDVPFEKLVEELSPERDLSRAPLFQVTFALQNTPRASVSASEVSRDLRLTPFGGKEGVVKFDLELKLMETEEEIRGFIDYDAELFENQTIQRLSDHMQRLFEEIVKAPHKRIMELSMLSAAQDWQLRNEWNDTEAEYPEKQCVHEVFEWQVKRRPDAVAASTEGLSVSYQELNRRANMMARSLVGSGVGPEVSVALLAKRDIELLTSMMAVFKAGGVYVPLDPHYPIERLRQVIVQSESNVVLTSRELINKVDSILEAEGNGEGLTILRIEELSRDVEEIEIVESQCDPRNLAYVIFTSGSTGTPKGAMIEHKGMLNHLYAKISSLSLEEGDAIAETASQSFDISMWQFLAPVLVGARVHIIEDEKAHEPRWLLRAINENNITVLEVVPSMLVHLLEEIEITFGKEPESSGLRVLVVTGESLPVGQCRSWLSKYPGVPLLNAYGPTECSDDVTQEFVKNSPEEKAARVPVGRPLSNTRTYIANGNGQLVPIGIEGELYVGGVGVGRGYFKDSAQTARVFIPDGFGTQGGERLYRTGDRARYDHDGSIDFLGRMDHQVKVRGYRIELGEIEALMVSHPEVEEAVAVASEHARGERSLVGYVVMKEGGEAREGELRSYLREKLPEYMVPMALVRLDRIPLTTNGKVDRSALPEPQVNQAASERERPMTPVEEIVAGIWSELLRLEEVGVDENFFDLGGHSLLATQVMSRLRDVLRVEVPLRVLFESPTVAGLAEAVERERGAGRLAAEASIRPVSRDMELPLSYAQQRLWFIQQLEPDGSTYNIPSAVRLRGTLDISSLRQSLQEIARRHEVLRTRFVSFQGRPVQVIDEPHEVALPIWEVSGFEEGQWEQRAREIVGQEARRPFDLEREPVWRGSLVRLGAEDHLLLLDLHHIASDGWSTDVMVREFRQLYDAFRTGRQSPLPELKFQYADFAVWQRQWLQGKALEQELNYWQQQLAGSPVLELPTDRTRPAVASHEGAKVPFRLSVDLTRELRALSRRERLTLFMTLLAGFQALLSRYTAQEDIVVGTPIAGRNRAETEGMIGFFVNTLVIRTDVSLNPTVRELLSRVRETALDSYAHQNLPFEKLVEELRPERSLSREPLFQIMFVLQNAPRSEGKLSDLSISIAPMEVHTAKFDITLSVTEGTEQIHGWLEYATDLYDRDRIGRLLGHLSRVLEGLVADAESRVMNLPLLTEQEWGQVVVEWNTTAVIYPVEKCVHELFEKQVGQAPEAMALVYEDQQLTYGELNRRANRLARHLLALRVAPEVRVALSLDRGLDMVVGVLGVLKVGGAYVPLDPSYPKERLAYMTEDSQVEIILTERTLVPRMPKSKARVLCLELEQMEGGSDDNLETVVDPESVAYVIYTSGSTGKPKGIALPHRALSNLIHWHYTLLPGGSRTLQFASLSFDASFHEIFSALCSGGTVFIAPEALRIDFSGLAQFVSESATDKVILPVVVLQQLAERYSERPDLLTCVEELITTGEQLHITRPVIDLFTGLRNCKLHNHYGPSETHVVTSFTLTGPPEFWPAYPSIGRPICNAQIFVLDHKLNPTPVGVPGEIFVGGLALARGYLKRPNLTAERFIPNPYIEQHGERLYRTGDIGFYKPDGNIHYLGRVDHQVKIRGFRVELGEIEAVMAQHPGVQESLVVVRNDALGDRRLAAYVVTSESNQALISELRSHLRSELPEYMVPSSFVLLDRFPLTPNGKIDRRALPDPETQRQEATTFVPPRRLSEKIVADIWSGILGVEHVGIFDNFFDLGGHSLLATQVISRVRDLFQVEQLPLRRVFETPTVAGLVEAVVEIWGSIEIVDEVAQTVYDLQQLSSRQVEEMLRAESMN